MIFGLLNIINFAHGAQYMMGAFCAWFLLNKLGLSYWWALLLAPLIVGATGVVIERLMLSASEAPITVLRVPAHLRPGADHPGTVLRQEFGSTGLPYSMPKALEGGQNLGFMFLPNYRAWVIAASVTVCFGNLVHDRENQAGLCISARGDSENPQARSGLGINASRA